VTVGAATLGHHSAPVRLQASPSPSALAAPPPPSVGPVRVAPSKPARVKAVVVKPHPTPAYETSPPTTTPPVGDDVTPPPPVVVPEPPGFAMSGSSDFETTVRCDCGTAPTTVDQIDGDPDGIASFTEVVSDAALADATGETAWGLWLQQSSPDGVSHQMIFDLYTPAGPERYLADGAVVSVKPTDWGGWTYVFEGEYGFSAGPPEGLDFVPTGGTYRMTVTLSVTSGRVVSTALQLTQDVLPTVEVTPSPEVSPSPDADVPQVDVSPTP
jgi:hypothetical protein